MPNTREKYLVLDVDLYHVRNRAERRVAQSMNERIAEKGLENELSPGDVKDIYAYALNQLQSRYSQQGTIILREPVRKERIDMIVEEAIKVVIHNPKRR